MPSTSVSWRNVLSGEEKCVLPELMKAGGSPGSARPKVLVGLKKNHIISGEGPLPAGYEHWIIKFNTGRDDIDSGSIEYAYSLMAKDCDLNMPVIMKRSFELSVI